MPKTTTPNILSRTMSRQGLLAAPQCKHKDKVRAGHMGWAKRLRNLAKKATTEEAAALIQQAEKHERKAA